MKKRILSLILALSMVLSVLPLGAFAGSSTQDLIIGSDGYPVGSNGGTISCSGTGWTYSKIVTSYPTGKLTLTSGEFKFSSTAPVECAIHLNGRDAKITGGTFKGKVSNTFGTISDGTFDGEVTNYATIENGIFKGTVTNEFTGTISGGTFAAGLSGNEGTVTGGVFNGNANLTGVTGLHSITWDAASSNAKIEKVNGVAAAGESAVWDPYVVIEGNTLPEVTITADTEIYSLNGYPIEGSPYNSSYPDTSNKKTVTFTMPDENVVLGTGDLVMKDGYPVGSNNGADDCEGKGWEYSKKDTSNPNGKLILKGINREFDFSLANPQDTTNKTPADSAVKCAIESGAKITGGTFEGSVKNYWYITDGIFDGTVTNIRDWFDGSILTGTIQGGTFNGNVENNINAAIEKNGTFTGTVNNAGRISDGTFKGDVINNNRGDITGGTFNKKVTNKPGGYITGGTFAGSVENEWEISGGVFNGKTGLDRVTGVHNITWDAASSKAKITEVNGVPAEWDPYIVVTESTPAKTKVVTITADTDIYSLNGQPIDTGNCNSSYGSGKTTVTFTMPDKDVVLSTGELVMEGGFPVGSNNGANNCEGKGWEYKGLSEPTDSCTLILKSGTYNFSLANPQDTTNKTPADSAVACAIVIQSSAKISGGTFEGEVKNYGSIDKGTFEQEVINNAQGTISDGTFNGTVSNSGTITGNGTFLEKVTNNQGGNITNGTFNHTVENDAGGTISNGTFEQEVINNDGGEISGGTFKGTVLNGNGIITGGTFAAGLSRNDGSVTGGAFNGKTGLTTKAHQVTVTNGSVSQVNGVDPRNADGTTGTAWDLYAYKGTTVIITADTEIFSLNGQPIDAGNCNSSYGSDKKTVTFTMPDEDVVLNRTAELTVVDGEIKSGETAEGSGRVRIGGKVEVTTKDKTQDFVGWTIAPEGIELRHDDGSAVDLTSERTFSFMMPDVSGGKLTLKANYQPFRTSLLMNADGTVNLEHVNHETYDGNETCKGDGWNVFNRGTLILEKGTYDFRYTAPTEKTGTLEAVTCGVQNKGGTIENGVFRNLVLNEDGGTITGGVFNGKTGLTNAHHVTVTNGSLLKVNGEDPLNADETTGTMTTGTAWDLYAYAGTTVTITADTDIFSLNGQPISTGNCNSSYPDENDKTTVKFTMPNEDVVLNEEINYGDLVMKGGYPEASNGGTTPCKGDGWEYIKNDPTNGDMLLLTGSNQTGGLYDFSAIGDGSAVECNVFVGKPTAITGGEFNGKVINNSGILGGTFNGEVENMGPGTIEKGTFNGAVENNGMIENGTFHDEVKNNGTINDGAFDSKVENNGTIENGTFYDEVKNNGTINDGAFNGKVENNSAINSGTFNGPVDNTASGTIEKGTFHGAVENKGTINGGVFNGAVTSSGTVSESITGSGTLNGEPITKTPEPEPEPKPEPKPEPEPTTYTVTVIGGTIDGKTSVSAKENDTLTVVLDQSDIPDGMTFDMWSISSDKLSGDINVDYRAEAMTFQMPAEDVTIRAQYRSAEIIEDAAPSPLATAATVALGGAAAGIVVWQGVSLGVDLYLTSALPQGVPVPTDRRALALLLWETAGKPEVALPTLYGDVPAEEIALQKATHWAVQNGLMDAADKKDASLFDPDHYVTKMDVFGAWLRLKKLLGTT